MTEKDDNFSLDDWIKENFPKSSLFDKGDSNQPIIDFMPKADVGQVQSFVEEILVKINKQFLNDDGTLTGWHSELMHNLKPHGKIKNGPRTFDMTPRSYGVVMLSKNNFGTIAVISGLLDPGENIYQMYVYADPNKLDSLINHSTKIQDKGAVVDLYSTEDGKVMVESALFDAAKFLFSSQK